MEKKKGELLMCHPFFSILIPVFNTRKALPRCLDSIFTQSCEDFEIILVDDASTDNSRQIAETYAKRDSRLKIIALSENSGRDNARLTAIKAASGNYIIFCDSDDELLPDFLEKAKKYSESNCDIIVFGRTRVSGELVSAELRHQMRAWTLKHRQILKGKEIFRAFFLEKKFSCALWGKCFKSELLKQCISDPLTTCTGEDFLRITMAFCHAETLLYVRSRGYIYHYGNGIYGQQIYQIPQLRPLANSHLVYSAVKDFLAEKKFPVEYFTMLEKYRDENLEGVLHMSTWLPDHDLEDGQKMLHDIWGEELYFHVLARYLARAEKQYTESLSWKITRPLRWLRGTIPLFCEKCRIQKNARSKQ